MHPQNDLNKLFFHSLDLDQAQKLVTASLADCDGGELYLQYAENEAITLDDHKIRQCSYNVSNGFGLRGIVGELIGYAYSSHIDLANLQKASKTLHSLPKGNNSFIQNITPSLKLHKSLYSTTNPLPEVSFDHKIELLKQIDHYIRSKNPLVRQVSVSLLGSYNVIGIVRPNTELLYDIRPLVRLNISVTLEKDGRMEVGSSSVGGRASYDNFINKTSWQNEADEALRQASVNMKSIPAKAGEKVVVLGPGWPGVLLHEAVGHGLEGDFNRKQTSTFSNSLNKQVAAKGVTVIDDGTLPDRRGSLNIDDEGTPTQRNTLIEDGVLVNYMQDLQNAKLMNMKPTGNGRRESYAHAPMPRMTNTFMLPGKDKPDDIIASVKDGIYAKNFGGGQVDIVSGNFVFSASECYLIENGKITTPLKGMTLIGNGPDTMKKITAIGDDLQLDKGTGTCGKNGQSVPVGVGQPTLLISSITVGGTE